MFCAVTSQSGNFFVSFGAAVQWQNLRGLSKHHWCLHMASCLSILKCLPSCPAMERKQKVVHKYGNNIMNTTQYEKSLLSKVLREHLAHLEADEGKLDTGCPYEQPCAYNKEDPEAAHGHWLCVGRTNSFSSNTCRLASGAISTVGDFVFVGCAGPCPYKCGQVQCIFQVSSLEMCLLQIYSFLGDKVGTQATKWKHAGHLELVAVDAVLSPVVYGHIGKDECFLQIWIQKIKAPIAAAFASCVWLGPSLCRL